VQLCCITNHTSRFRLRCGSAVTTVTFTKEIEGCAIIEDFIATSLEKVLSYLYATDYDDAATSTDTVVAETVIHVRVYILANFLDLQALRELALQKFNR
jgi:hypothetical protein